LLDKLIAWQRHLHQHPELSFQEVETAKFIVQELEKRDNIYIQKNVGGHGVVATLTNGKGQTIGDRADIDALPIIEKNIHDYASKRYGVMHACGHDAHTAMLLGAAHILAQQFKEKELKGTVKLIFQPAEERTDEHGLSGAP